MKKFAALAIAAILGASLCVPTFAEEAKDFTVVVNLKTLSSEYWQTVKSGIDEAAEELGMSIDVQGPAAETEIQEQVQQLETMLAANPDAIIIAPLDGDAVIGAIENAGYEGTVVFCDTDCAYENKVSFVGTSNEDAAYNGGKYGVEINGEDTKALIIYGQEGDNTSNLRKSGYEKALAEAGLEPVAEMSGNNTTDGATKVMEDMLNAYPDGINLVLCHNDDTALGALNAIEAAGAEGISIIGFDGNQSAIESIKAEGIAATIAQQPKLMGYLSVMTAVDALQGKEVEPNVSVDTVIIDGANCDEYLAG